MSLSTEQTYRRAVQSAESARQDAKAAAFTTYAYNSSTLTTYQVAIADADVAYFTAVNTAADALNQSIGSAGYNGPIPGAMWTLLQQIS